MKTLLERMKQNMELKGFSPRTQECYHSYVKKFEQHYKRSSECLGNPEIKDYLEFLIKEKQASSSSVNQAYSALKFLYETTLDRKWVMKKIPRVKREKKLSTVLDREEVQSLFAVIRNLKHRFILMTTYSTRAFLNLLFQSFLPTPRWCTGDIPRLFYSVINCCCELKLLFRCIQF